MSGSRLPETRTLAQILPKGTEGGKEFARIVDLLLFHEARRKGRTINLFSDAAGDFRGLDSFGAVGDTLRRDGTVGYQYKFYPSPLSDSHRSEIKAALKQAAEHQKEQNLKKWILVTPDSLTESAQRKDCGDVSWFQGLKQELKLKFEVEHWGHRQLQGLFLETPALCLFYYPDLIPEGSQRRHTIEDTRGRYDKNLLQRYRPIEFVGMSIYKQEATRGVPIEDIYIPLKLVNEGANSDDPKVTRRDPLECLAPGRLTVLLGDPGSGKSTLLRFLALVGLSQPLQKRCKAHPDQRLPVLCLLRRYADELSRRPNLPLLDYLCEVVRADFSLTSADQEFFEYYLESGQAILLFDGLDELSHSGLKQTVRDRIRALATTYPGNTFIVTSRIVGYENPFRFDEKEFHHFQVARLQLPEMKQFVTDWYAARIEHPQDREEHSTGLIGLLEKNEHSAIRELAGNPLLLTIIALVHRIDAVLPDERVVLYQKCTETLLNTWHNWKYKEQHSTSRGKTERRNSRRMEAIAHWMQTRSDQSANGQRAVAPFEKLRDFLRDHIRDVEKVADEEDALDQADDFLDFVKKRAGLLIEVGDKQYSFVHLTFQEYSTATHMGTQSEKEGVTNAWTAYIAPHRCDPAWREVIRLFIASLKAEDSQEYLVGQLLEQTCQHPETHGATLLGGLILDGIVAAEERQQEIAECLLRATPDVKGIEELRQIITTWRGCSRRSPATRVAMEQAFSQVWPRLRTKNQRFAVVLMLLTSNWSRSELAEVAGSLIAADTPETVPLRLLFSLHGLDDPVNQIPEHWESFVATMQWASSYHTSTNLLSAAATAVATVFGPQARSAMARRTLIYAARQISGPFVSWLLHVSIIGMKLSDHKNPLARDLDRARARARDLARDLARALDLALARARDQARDRTRALDRARDLARDLDLARALDLARDLDLDLDLDLDRDQLSRYWTEAISNSEFEESFLRLLIGSLGLKPGLHWEEALRMLFVPTIPSRIDFFEEASWDALAIRFEQQQLMPGDEDLVAVLLLLDSLLFFGEAHAGKEESRFARLAKLTRDSVAPVLRLAHCIRDLAYGDASRTDDLVAMVNSEDPAYRKLMEECLWRLTPEEEAREAEAAKKAPKK